MTRTRANEIQMMKVVRVILRIFAAVFAAIPAFVAIVVEFENLLDEIDNTTTKTEAIKTGMRTQKKINKADLAHKAAKVVNALFAFGNNTNDPELVAEIKYPEYVLKRMKDTRLISICRDILALGQEHHTELEAYGIVAADLTNLDDAITVFDTIVPESQAEIDHHKYLLEHLDVLVVQGLDMMKLKIDHLVKVVADANPEFADLYFKARAIDDFRGKSKKTTPPDPEATTGILELLVLFKDTMLPAVGANFLALMLNISELTDIDGETYNDALEPGTYEGILHYDGYKVINFTFTIEAAKITSLQFLLEKEDAIPVPPMP